jgi:hypothetical protein
VSAAFGASTSPLFCRRSTASFSNSARAIVRTGYAQHRYVKEDDHASNEAPEPSFAERLAELGTQRGTLENVKDATGEREGPAEPRGPLRGDAVTRHGFNLHASVTIAAGDDLGRERLCRYGLRPSFSLSRFRRLRDGRISYRVKKWLFLGSRAVRSGGLG